MNKLQIIINKVLNEIAGSEANALMSGNASTSLTGTGSYDGKIGVFGALAISQDDTPKGNGKSFKKHKKINNNSFPKTKQNKPVLYTATRPLKKMAKTL